MLHDVKSLFGRLLRNRLRVRAALPAPPNFEEAALFAHLREPLEAAEAWHAGRREIAWEILIDHFRRRIPPLGFTAPECVPGLLADVERRFPAWRGRLLAKVREDRHQGLDRKSTRLNSSH